ncbi:hypothetical protein J3R82DRAFT_8744 [Butyriboletus roseoflavus]|nr:hypothetical protein J3R82DRAFT_8744 [Butyriboletus roseoflavus]
MWGMSDSDEEYSESDEDMELQKEEPPPGVTGLALAEHYLGHCYRLSLRLLLTGQHTPSIVAVPTPNGLGLDDGTLRKCISIISRDVEMDDIDVSRVCLRTLRKTVSGSSIPSSQPRNADILVRIYSPATPKYIDVHIKYHCRSRMYEIEWFYSLGYSIYNRISGSADTYRDPSTNGPPSRWHTRGGWQSICWGYYDDDGNYGRRWRRIEVAEMGLHEDGVLDVHEVLFGPIDTPPNDNVDAVLEYRKKLVATVRLLFAAVGIRYGVACTDEETDERPEDYMLEGLGDKWVARGVREACGFQLSKDAEAASRGQEERREAAAGEDDIDCEDDFSDDGWF